MRPPKHPLKGREPMRRPWKVPLQKNRTLQSCLAVSLALHLLVIILTAQPGKSCNPRKIV